jgi:hypothetical protein
MEDQGSSSRSNSSNKPSEQVQLKLTPEQLKILSSKAKALSDGKLTIQIFDGEKLVGQMKASECAYYSDTCCA